MVVFVEASVLEDRILSEYENFNSVKERLMTFRSGTDDLTDKIDFIICLGGDGTLLHASSLFQVNNNKSIEIMRTASFTLILTYKFL